MNHRNPGYKPREVLDGNRYKWFIINFLRLLAVIASWENAWNGAAISKWGKFLSMEGLTGSQQ